MANSHQKSPRTNSTRNFLLGCFGFSRKKHPDGKTLRSNNITKPRNRCFHWSTSRINKSAAKTVPVDHSMELTNPSKNSTKIRPRSNSKFSGQVSEPEISEETTPAHDRPNSILGARKPTDRHVESSKFETCQQRTSFSRKIDAIRTGSGQPGPSQVKPKSSSAQTHPSTRLSQSRCVSLPPATQEIRIGNPPGQFRVGSREPIQRVNGKYEPVMGLWIVIMTLIIMLFWGRLCAILCTSAWFYFCPRLMRVINDNEAVKNGGDSKDLDLNSAEHKKRVVLEGFLERNHNHRCTS